MLSTLSLVGPRSGLPSCIRRRKALWPSLGRMDDADEHNRSERMQFNHLTLLELNQNKIQLVHPTSADFTNKNAIPPAKTYISHAAGISLIKSATRAVRRDR